jgi:hypothetical protein
VNAPLRPGDRVTFDGLRDGHLFDLRFAATIRSEIFYVPGSSLGPFILIDPDDPNKAYGLSRDGHRMVNASALIRISDLREKINAVLDALEKGAAK